MSSGLSATSIFAHFVEKEHTDHTRVCRTHVVMVAGELIVLFIVIALAFSGLLGPVAVQSGTLLLFDQFSAVFWFLFVGVGLLGPLILYIKYPVSRYAVQWRQKGLQGPDQELETNNTKTLKPKLKYFLYCDMAVLIGGLSLRCLIIFAALPIWDGRLI